MDSPAQRQEQTVLPEPPGMGALLVCLDRSDDAAWNRVLNAASAIYPQDWDAGGTQLLPVTGEDLNGRSPEALAEWPAEGYIGFLLAADARSMADLTVVAVQRRDDDFGVTGGATFRCVPEQVEGLVVNLCLANMDFEDYARSVGEDGVFRGFHEVTPSFWPCAGAAGPSTGPVPVPVPVPELRSPPWTPGTYS